MIIALLPTRSLDDLRLYIYISLSNQGGVHGVNRLGGSSLLDCVVFGRQAAQTALHHVASRLAPAPRSSLSALRLPPAPLSPHLAFPPLRVLTGGVRSLSPGPTSDASTKQPAEGVSETEFTVIVRGARLDFSQFTHPGGALQFAKGDDLTARFQATHGEDWALLDRPDIVHLDKEEGAAGAEKGEVEAGRPSYLDYGGTWGTWREWLGRRAWFLLHSIAAKYPEYPSLEVRGQDSLWRVWSAT